jgi:hypothetical protein
MTFSACLDTSPHRVSHPFKDARVLADSLTSIDMVSPRCPLVCKQELKQRFQVSSKVQIQRFKSVEGDAHAVGLSVPVLPSWHVLFRTSSTRRLNCFVVPSCMNACILGSCLDC